MAKKGKQTENGLITLRSGVVLRPKRVGYWIINEAMRKLRPPEVPVQFIEEKGRKEPNPMHPDYVAAMAQYSEDRGNIAVNAYMFFGTEIITRPPDVPGPDDEWGDEYEFMGITPARNKAERYVQWLKLVACRGDDVESASIIAKVVGQTTVSEAEVADAAESFRGDPVRGADMESTAKKAGTNGD
jgi:hypothetical protein